MEIERCEACTIAKKPNDEEDIGTNEVAVAKCIDCDLNLCSKCLLGHRLICAYTKHKISPIKDLNNNFEKPSIVSKSNCQQSHISHPQQNSKSINYQLIVKDQEQIMVQQHIAQIEAEIHKTFGLYMQKLEERRDYLINELNILADFTIRNHQENFDKHLKIKTEIEQKLVEIAESTNKYTKGSSNNFNGNNHYTTSSIVELNRLAMLNYQMLHQIKTTNPIAPIEFVPKSNFIETSIKNTFGYVRFNNNKKITKFNQNKKNSANHDGSTISSDSGFTSIRSSPGGSFNRSKCKTDYETHLKTMPISLNDPKKDQDNMLNVNQESDIPSLSLSSSLTSNALFNSLTKNDISVITELIGGSSKSLVDNSSNNENDLSSSG